MRCYVNDSDAIEEIDSQIARLEEMLASNSFGLAERRITHCLERKGVVRDLHLIGRSILLLFGDIMTILRLLKIPVANNINISKEGIMGCFK